jgi:hypothetical protein
MKERWVLFAKEAGGSKKHFQLDTGAKGPAQHVRSARNPSDLGGAPWWVSGQDENVDERKRRNERSRCGHVGSTSYVRLGNTSYVIYFDTSGLF